MAAEKTRLTQGKDGPAVPSPGPEGEHDRQQVYCRRLGHYLEFSYCRRAEAGASCPRVLDCWYNRPAVLGPLPAGGQAPPPGKLESILAIVAQVRGRQEAEPQPD